uniref:Uncharacterized protein n=1 Tax=Physcomitrium patens TaxID=3218 RepID=A0A2K1JRT1_PHYPA|nr:hypothetical protein PHYPA_016625 [Physcomitrium patens]
MTKRGFQTLPFSNERWIHHPYPLISHKHSTGSSRATGFLSEQKECGGRFYEDDRLLWVALTSSSTFTQNRIYLLLTRPNHHALGSFTEACASPILLSQHTLLPDVVTGSWVTALVVLNCKASARSAVISARPYPHSGKCDKVVSKLWCKSSERPKWSINGLEPAVVCEERSRLDIVTEEHSETSVFMLFETTSSSLSVSARYA